MAGPANEVVPDHRAMLEQEAPVRACGPPPPARRVRPPSVSARRGHRPAAARARPAACGGGRARLPSRSRGRGGRPPSASRRRHHRARCDRTGARTRRARCRARRGPRDALAQILRCERSRSVSSSRSTNVPPLLAGEQPVQHGGAGIADMDAAGRRRARSGRRVSHASEIHRVSARLRCVAQQRLRRASARARPDRGSG